MPSQSFGSLIGTTVEFEGQSLHISGRLGSGTFGEVLLAENKATREQFALKCTELKGTTDNESDLHHRVSFHRSIVSFLGPLPHPSAKIMVLEYIPNGDLRKFLQFRRGKLITDVELSSIILQLIDAVSACHKSGIFHRDLKLENVLVEDDGDGKGRGGGVKVFLCDFGFATREVESKEFRLGTPSYFSPENECKKHAWQAPFDVKSYSNQKNDVWGLGILILNLLSRGRVAWDSTVKDPSYTLFLQNPPSFLHNFAHLSPAAVKILVGLLTPDPLRRMGLFQARKMVEKVVSWKMDGTSSLARLRLEPPPKLSWVLVPTSPLVYESEEFDGPPFLAYRSGASSPCSDDSFKQLTATDSEEEKELNEAVISFVRVA